MQIKTKGLNIGYNQGYLALSMTEDAMKEFCDYHGIPYTEGKLHTNGIVTTRKWKIQSKMIHEYSKIVLNNNWRRRHRIPMIRKVCKKRWILKYGKTTNNGRTCERCSTKSTARDKNKQYAVIGVC